MVLAKRRVHIELESKLGLRGGCTYVHGAPPDDATMRSAAVNVGPTFDVPLRRLRGKRVKLDLRDSNRPFSFNRTTGTLSSRLRLKLTRIRR